DNSPRSNSWSTSERLLPSNGSRWRPDCLAGVGGLELRKSLQNIPLKGRTDFGRSGRILVIRDYSRLSCDVAETQLGPSAAEIGKICRDFVCVPPVIMDGSGEKRPKPRGSVNFGALPKETVDTRTGFNARLRDELLTGEVFRSMGLRDAPPFAAKAPPCVPRAGPPAGRRSCA